MLLVSKKTNLITDFQYAKRNKDSHVVLAKSSDYGLRSSCLRDADAQKAKVKHICRK